MGHEEKGSGARRRMKRVRELPKPSVLARRCAATAERVIADRAKRAEMARELQQCTCNTSHDCPRHLQFN